MTPVEAANEMMSYVDGQDNLLTRRRFVYLMWIVLRVLKHTHLTEAELNSTQNTVFATIIMADR